MDEIIAQPPIASKSKQKGSGCLFLFCLFFLFLGTIPTLLNVPGVQARFTGLQTTALVTADGSCSWEESDNNGGETLVNGYYYVYTYTVSSGKVYQITDTGCSNADTPGASETIWYQPADPIRFITANAWTFDWIFFLGFSLPTLLFLFAFVRRLFTRARRLTEPALSRSYKGQD